MIKHYFVALICFIITGLFFFKNLKGQLINESPLRIKKTNNFSITGKGNAENWVEIPVRETASEVPLTKFKILYSDKGLYFLFYCEDEVLTATMKSDFMKLWKEDVVEVFLWPDTNFTTYFEYELSPLNYELPILVSNINGKMSRWLPYMYEGDRKTKHFTTVANGEKKSGESIKSWTAEFFIPFKLLRPLNNITPVSGTKWKANFYRVDYDHGQLSYQWQPIETNFHDIDNFGTILFE